MAQPATEVMTKPTSNLPAASKLGFAVPPPFGGASITDPSGSASRNISDNRVEYANQLDFGLNEAMDSFTGSAAQTGADQPCSLKA